MKPKGNYTMECIEVQAAYKRKQENYLHLVKFKEQNGQTYVAEELSAAPVSSFYRGASFTFEVTHPGTSGKPDWIKFVSFAGEFTEADAQHSAAAKYNKELQYEQQRNHQPNNGEDICTAQIAFQCAIQLGLKNDWSDAQIIEKAFLFAGNIKRIGKQISLATDI